MRTRISRILERKPASSGLGVPDQLPPFADPLHRHNDAMPTHAEKRHVPHSPARDVCPRFFADIEKYPEFLPWCVGTRVRSNDGEVVLADMVIGYKMFREKFTSEVRLSRPDRIDVAYDGRPVQISEQPHWIFLREPDGTCTSGFLCGL